MDFGAVERRAVPMPPPPASAAPAPTAGGGLVRVGAADGASGTAPVATQQPAPVSQFEQRYERRRMLGRGAFGEAWLLRTKVPTTTGATPAKTAPAREIVQSPQAEGATAPTDTTAGAVVATTTGQTESADKTVAPVDGDVVAKKIRYAGLDNQTLSDMRREIRLLSSLSHPHVLKYVEHIDDPRAMYIITEYCDGGDLSQRIERYNRDKRHFAEEEIVRVVREILEALAYLHSPSIRILHRDLKSANIFFKGRGVMAVKLGDFGLSRILELGELAHTKCGTPRNFSPQIFKGKGYSSGCDIWAVGIIALEMIHRRHPFYHLKTAAECQHMVLNTRYWLNAEPGTPPPPQGAPDPPDAEVWSRYSVGLRNFVRTALKFDESTRPSAQTMLQLPIFSREPPRGRPTTTRAAEGDQGSPTGAVGGVSMQARGPSLPRVGPISVPTHNGVAPTHQLGERASSQQRRLVPAIPQSRTTGSTPPHARPVVGGATPPKPRAAGSTPPGPQPPVGGQPTPPPGPRARSLPKV